jgi:prophage regulatory protein
MAAGEGASMNRLLRVRQVEDVTGKGKSWIYEKVRKGEFPRPVKLGRSSVWIEAEVETYIDAQIRASREASEDAPSKEDMEFLLAAITRAIESVDPALLSRDKALAAAADVIRESLLLDSPKRPKRLS